MQTLSRLAVALLVVASIAAPAAAFTTTAQPDAAYQAATTVIPIAYQDFTVLNSVTDGTLTVNFDIPMSCLTQGVSWATWNVSPDAETASPRVLWTQGASQLTMSLSQAATTFGFEAEPNLGALFAMTADFYNGANLVGSIARNVNGNGGSLLFAATDAGGFTSVRMSMNGDFGIAQLRYDIGGSPPVPEPASVVLVTGSLLGLLVRRRRS